MNWGRGFFRLWLFVSALWWVIGLLLAFHDRAQPYFWENVRDTIATPFVVLALGAFLGWAIKGFKKGAKA
jgi:hypothetical protein